MRYSEKILRQLKTGIAKVRYANRYKRSSTKRKISMKLVKRNFRLIR